MVVGGSLVLAYVLRESMSWLRVLLTSLLVGLVSAWVLSVVFADFIGEVRQALKQNMTAVLGDAWQQLDASVQDSLLELLGPVLTGLMAAVVQMLRSEERRVGKECRSGRSPEQ